MDHLTPEQEAAVAALIAKYGWTRDEAIFAISLADGDIDGDIEIVDTADPAPRPITVGAPSSPDER